jgi:hypothetical protein
MPTPTIEASFAFRYTNDVHHETSTHTERMGNVLDLWIVFLEGSQSIHCDVSYTQI